MKNLILLLFCLLTIQRTFGQTNSEAKFYLNLSNKNFNSNLVVDKNESIQRYVKGTENAFFNYQNDKVNIVIFENNTLGISSIDESKLVLSKSSQTISFQSNTLIFEDVQNRNLKMIPRGIYTLSKGTYQAGLQTKNVLSTTINLRSITYNTEMPFHYLCAQKKVVDLRVPNEFILIPQFTDPNDTKIKLNTPDGVTMEVIGNLPYISPDGKLDLSKMPSQEPNEQQGIKILYRLAGSEKIHELKIKHFRVNDSEDLPTINCREFGMVARKSGQEVPQEGMGGMIVFGGGEGVVVASKPKSGPKNPDPDKDGTKDPTKPANKN
jgi:hypothetical protein